MEENELEAIRVGNWQTKIPTLICTDKDIFEEIFSNKTWNDVLSREQRRRIAAHLPPELQSPGETARTMDALFSSSLTRFGSSPLTTFFNGLDAGHYDPDVVETKNEIFKVWRKEALRRRKMYHTNLFQQILEGRDSLLKKSLLDPASIMTRLSNGNGTEVLEVENRPLKRVNGDVDHTSGAIKKPTIQNTTTTTKQPVTKILVTIPANVPSTNPPQTTTATPPTLTLANSSSVVQLSRKEQEAATLAKFPKILPAPAGSKPATTSNLKSHVNAQPMRPNIPVELIPLESSSSSDDEFESIEPTIGFEHFTNPKTVTMPAGVNRNRMNRCKVPASSAKPIMTTHLHSNSPRQAVPLRMFIPTATATTTTTTPSSMTAVQKIPMTTLSAALTAVSAVKTTTPSLPTSAPSATSTPIKLEPLKVTMPNPPPSSTSGILQRQLTAPLNLTPPKLTSLLSDTSDLGLLENPFDSIPNLSDELEGFDLDLVDGLSEFDSLLSEDKRHASFFSLIRDILCSTRDHRMTLTSIERTIKKWSQSSVAGLNQWFTRVQDWNDGLITALNFLAGSYQGSFHVHPEDFVPYIEYKYKTKYYQWIGAGRDSDNNLLPLCNMWLENLDKLPALKKPEESELEPEEDVDSDVEEVKKKNKRPTTPPPPRCVTDWQVRPSTEEEKIVFQRQERSRFESPHKAFTYWMHSYESVVGPVKGVYSSQSGLTNKARGHSLLVDERPPYVTILALVRDAVARLPNGEGTRSEICEMLRDSAYLASEASNVTLNSVVSGALDRLHYERDPCVRYDSHKKSWIYLHRDRSQEQFERLHHNRSYTKSTKSRSNTCRKSRKMRGQQQSGSGGSTAASTSTAGEDSPPPKPTTDITPKISTSLPSSSIPATTEQKPTIVKVEPTAVAVATPQVQQQTVESQRTLLSTASTSSTLKGWGSDCSTVSQGQINLNPAGAGTAVAVSAATPNATPASTTATSATSNLTSGHFILGSNLLRFATNVRFASLRLPATAGAQQGQVQTQLQGQIRIPQQRFLLARPDGNNSQPLLVGQTATGQTIILSTNNLAPSTLAGIKSRAIAAGGDGDKMLQAFVAAANSSTAHLAGTNAAQPASVMAVASGVSQLAKSGPQPNPTAPSSNLTQASTGVSQQPIFIRSPQGDFVIPAHISLQQGLVQGIKVITGKQLLTTRFVTPAATATTVTGTQTQSSEKS